MMRMRFMFAIATLFVVAPFWSGLAHGAGRPSAAGLWQAMDDDNKQPTGWFLISDHNGVHDGKIYKATMKLSPDGQMLTVRGYIGFELLGQNQYWTRLPDSAYTMLDSSINPNPAVNANPTANPAANQKRPPAAAHKSELPQQATMLRGSKP